ncbi:hypothetical protein AWB77_01485 [Caballeronia fortuita]|uniref:Uncharacterized protein n=1 Tax=Caballeronia fortuita TaxID=1777138 RepID=A0A158A894_9BURK|nr:SIR2 family protein [Caballeronia fortuita]SAK53949.1 hypothetical protein AWB77_01485 [Caballeronia fortuita]
MKAQEYTSISQRVNKLDGAVHLERIRNALLENHACVMIGSGFSLNAQYGNRLTMWAGMIDSLLDDLYATDRAKQDAKKRLGGTSGMLRLAEEYAAVRGRAQLDAKMHELLPDAGVVIPGDLHTKLLALPWTDVYTTNYDTLLERALDTDRRQFHPRIRRQYQVVVAANNVPFSRRNGRPRVVKLHGSLRSGTKLIVTEEDYRSYPEEFAPFVNTVQQSMLENVFCLIGFSGDDPNFLAWSGWVRDRLGDRTPPIYLISLSPVSEGQRLVLERRNVIPLNIGPLGTCDDSVDYGLALDLLLDYWADKPVRRRSDWPYHAPSRALRQKADIATIVNWARDAARNRGDYPGWLISPAANRERLDHVSVLWQLFSAYRSEAEGMPFWLRAVVIDEAAWIEDQTLSPLSKYRYETILELLGSAEANRSCNTTHDIPEDASSLRPSDEQLIRIIRRLTVHAMRYCRETGDADNFARFASQLNSPQKQAAWDDNDWAALYESLLFDLETRRGADALQKANRLSTADSPSVDLYWRVRAGALLGEMGAVQRANEVLRSALHGIRERIFAEGESVALLSREQWAERILDVCRQARASSQTTPARKPELVEDRPSNSSRQPEISLRELIAQEEGPTAARPELEDEDTVERNHAARDNVEHPSSLSKELLKELDFAETMLQAANVEFDARTMSTPIASPFFRDEAQSASATFCRFGEVAAYVPAVGQLGVSAKRWITAYRILSITIDATINFRIFNRVSTAAWLTKADALDMGTVAELTADSAIATFSHCHKEITTLLETKELPLDRAARTYLRFHMDLMSRVAFRLGEKQATTLMDLAILLHESSMIRSDRNVHPQYSTFLSRTLRLVSRRLLEEKAPDLLRLKPLRGLQSINTWPDIIQALREEGARFDPKITNDWRDVIDRVLAQAEEDEPGHEQEADNFSRLDLLFRRNLMSAEQSSRFARLIYRNVEHGELPLIKRFYRGAALTWPSPDDRSPTEDFRRWLKREQIEFITRQPVDDGKAAAYFGTPGESLLVNVLLTEGAGVRGFSWTESLILSVVEELRRWWSAEGAALLERAATSSNDSFLSDIMAARMRLIAHAMQRVLVPNLSLQTCLRDRLHDWLAELWHAGLRIDAPLVPLLFAGLVWWPQQERRVIEIANSVLVSSRDVHVVTAAMSAAGRWLLQLKSPTDVSARHVQHLVEGVRRKSELFLDRKLNNITELLKQGASYHFVDHAFDICSALCELLHSLRYDYPAANLLERAARPILRDAIVSLLVAIRHAIPSVKQLDTWNAAMDFARADPVLPVRNLAADTGFYGVVETPQ